MGSSRIELRREEIQENPYPTYAYMREHEPVCLLADGEYALTREQDVRWALGEPDIFSSTAIAALSAPDWLRPEFRRTLSMLSMDPPEHSKFRSVTSKQFAGSVIRRLTPLMQRTAERLIAELAPRNEVEFMSEFSFPYISELIGGINVSGQIPPLDDAKTVLELRELNTPDRPCEEHIRALEQEFEKQNAYYDAVLNERQVEPREDLATLLVQTRIDGQPLSYPEMRDTLDLFMSAGFHTPAQFLATAMLHLSRMPELRTQLAHDSALIPDFIEELLRYDGPTHRLPRKLTREIVLHGIVIPKGATVSLIVAAANHDPSVFRDPETFDIARPNNRQHMQFAVGPHTCIGMGMARTETRIALEAILPRIKSITLAPGYTPQYTGTLTTRGLRRLMLRFQ